MWESNNVAWNWVKLINIVYGMIQNARDLFGGFLHYFYFHLKYRTEKKIRGKESKRAYAWEMRVGWCQQKREKSKRGGRHQQVLAVIFQHDLALDAFLTLIIALKIVWDELVRKRTRFVSVHTNYLVYLMLLKSITFWF